MGIETLDDILEDFANMAGIYGCYDKDCLAEMDHEIGHPDQCQCRMCWQIEMKGRIYAAVEVERKLEHIP